MRRKLGVAGSVSALIAALLFFASPAQAAGCGSSWSVASSPNKGTGTNALYGVGGSSASDLYGVGTWNNGSVYRTLVQHWNGTKWKAVASPNKGPYNNILYSTSAAGPSDAWAVGYRQIFTFGSFLGRTLALHWDGSTWSAATTPDIKNSNDSLSGVAVVASNDVWAVGTAGLDFQTTVNTLVLHWNGSSWSRIKSPNDDQTYSYLSSVAGGAGGVWAVGGTLDSDTGATVPLILRESAGKWFLSPSPVIQRGYLTGVAPAGPNDVWAVGAIDSPNSTSSQTLIEHWNGSAWTQVSSPNPSAHDGITGVSFSSSSDIWTSGYLYDGSSRRVPMSLRYNGSTWSDTSATSGLGTNPTWGVADLGGQVMLVGYQTNGPLQTFTERICP